MSMLCKLFGHKIPSGYAGDAPYAKPPPANIWTDGTGRGHVHLYVDCARCGTAFHALSFHPLAQWIGNKPTAPERAMALEEMEVPSLGVRAFNLARCLAQAEFRPDVDRCIDEAKAIMSALSASPIEVEK